MFLYHPIEWLLLGLLMLMYPHPSQQHASLQHVVLLQQQDATKLEAKFKQKSEVVG